jgi:hypothetical protein
LLLILDPVVTGKTVEREQVGILEIDRARILVGDGEIANRRTGNKLDPRREHLGAAKRFANERPFHVDRGERDAACGPTLVAAITRRECRERLVGVIDIAAHQPGKGDHLAQRSEPPQVPSCACKGALGILPFGADQVKRVGLKLQSSAQHRIIDKAAIIERGERDRYLSLIGVDPQGLGRPASDAEIGIAVNPLDIDGRA